MNRSDSLKQARAAKIEAQTALNKKLTDEKRSAFTDEETTQFRALQSDIDKLDGEIKDALAYEANIRSLAGGAGSKSHMKPEERENKKMMERYSVHKAIRSLIPSGQEGHLALAGVELEVHQEVAKRARDAGETIAGVGIPMADFRANPNSPEKRFGGQSVTQDGGDYGAALVAEDRREIIEFLRPRPVVEQLGARYMTGLEGNLVFPVNEGGITAYWEGEIDETPESKNRYTKKNMTPKRLGAAVPITLQNLMQSSIDLQRFTMDEINAVMALALDLAAINGSGSGNVPLGILNAPGVNTLSTGTNGGAPTFAQLVQAGVLVRNANAANLAGSKFGWLINPLTSGKLETTQKVDGQAIYLKDDMGKIAGYPSNESSLVPGNLTKGTGTNLSAAVFGDWNQLLIGQWGWVDVTVDNISKKREGYIEIIVNAFYDVLVRQPKAFTIIKDWVTT